MQVVYKNEDEGSSHGGANLVGTVIYIRKISRCMEGKYIRRSGEGVIRI